MRRWLSIIAVVAVLLILGVEIAEACPMCAEALANGKSDKSQDAPRAFYYSILFMLSMPFLLTGAFGFAFYRLHKQKIHSHGHTLQTSSGSVQPC